MTSPRRPASDHVMIVLGHRSDLHFGVHIISQDCLRRVRRAEALAGAENVRAVILSGWGMVGHSEAAQMASVWSGAQVPLLLEQQSTNTAENATRCLEMVLAMPGVKRVTVVTSAWHLRTPYFFQHFKEHGIRVDFRFAPVALGDWPRYLAYELRSVRSMRRMRQAALRQVGHDACRTLQPPDVAA